MASPELVKAIIQGLAEMATIGWLDDPIFPQIAADFKAMAEVSEHGLTIALMGLEGIVNEMSEGNRGNHIHYISNNK